MQYYCQEQLQPLGTETPQEASIPSSWYSCTEGNVALIHPSAKHLLAVRDKIMNHLGGLNLKLHPKKMYLQHYAKGVMFVGGMIKPGRKYISNRTIGRLFAKVHWYNTWLAATENPCRKDIESMVACMNSYLGTMRHYNSDRLFHRFLSQVGARWYGHTYINKRGTRVKLMLKAA